MTRFLVSCTVLILFFTSCESQLSSYSSGSTKLDNSIAVHAVDSIVLPYRSAMTAQMAEVIGYADSALFSYAPESPLSNFVADVIFETGFEYAKSNSICTDSNDIFCLLNFGGIRTSLNQGEITLGEIYELMPFDNSIVIVEISSDSLDGILDYLFRMNGQPVSNFSARLSASSNGFSLGPNGKSNSEFVYVITSDYLAGGGDKMTFLQNPSQRWDTGILIRECLISYIQEKKKIPYYPIENRIVIN